MTEIKRPKPPFVAPVGMTFPRGNSEEALTMGQLQDNIEQLARTNVDLQAQIDAILAVAAAVEEPKRVRRVREIRKPLEVEDPILRMAQVSGSTTSGVAHVAPDFIFVQAFPLTDAVNPFSFFVRIPHLMRETGNEGAAAKKLYPNADDITYTHNVDNQSQERDADEAGGDMEVQTITPQYHAGEILVVGRVEEEFIINPDDAFVLPIGVSSEPTTTPWIDMNVAGRHWAV